MIRCRAVPEDRDALLAEHPDAVARDDRGEAPLLAHRLEQPAGEAAVGPLVDAHAAAQGEVFLARLVHVRHHGRRIPRSRLG